MSLARVPLSDSLQKVVAHLAIDLDMSIQQVVIEGVLLMLQKHGRDIPADVVTPKTRMKHGRPKKK